MLLISNRVGSMIKKFIEGHGDRRGRKPGNKVQTSVLYRYGIMSGETLLVSIGSIWLEYPETFLLVNVPPSLEGG
jgi:hypothetical protein